MALWPLVYSCDRTWKEAFGLYSQAGGGGGGGRISLLSEKRVNLELISFRQTDLTACVEIHNIFYKMSI